MNEQEIFVKVLAQTDPADRLACLEEACKGDPPLKQRVEMLLQAHDRAGRFLESPAAGTDATSGFPPLSERPGTVIGPYKLLQQIGEGGMGVVYMAEQTEPIARRVALKIIKPGMDSRQVIARFEAERQALAMMDHVNIARVLDAGTTPAGRPYFVMELVHGVPITKYCDDNRLTPRQRLDLFVPVCQAIQHAHQKGIIHRDIKPTNVMVTLYDGQPVPKVIDFGVAKAIEQKLTERTLFTQYGTMVGTLEYMSPEQAEMSALGVDTRSDIYSLGVLLYELLTGNTPLTHLRMKEGAYAEILRMIKEDEPPKPSTRLSDSGEALASISANRHTEPAKLTKLVRGELDWIVMKTLEKDRNRRYETAKDFAADVQRYLSDEPVQACPPSAGYRLRKFARRNRVAMLTTALVAVALVAGTVVSAWQAIRATRARHDAEVARTDADQRRVEADEQRQQAEDARKEALGNLQKAREAGEEFFTRVSENRLLEEPGLQPLRKELLEAGVAYYEGLAVRSGKDPNVQVDVILARLRLVQVYYQIGYHDSYVSALDKALDLVEIFIREHPHAADLHGRLAGFWHGGRKLPAQRQWDARQGVRTHERAIARWEEFANRYSSVPGFQSDLSKFYDVLGYLYENLGDENERLRTRKRVCELREKIVRALPGVHEHVAELAHAYVNLAHALEATDAEESEKLYRQAIAIQKNVPDVSSYQQFLALHQWRLSQFLRRQDRPAEAIPLGQEAIGIYEDLAARFPHATNFRTVADRWKAVLESAVRQRKVEAIAAYQRAIDLNNAQPDNPDETIDAFRQAIRLDPDRVEAQVALGVILRDKKHDYEGAIACFSKAVEVDPKNATHHSHLGYALRLHGKLDDAIPSYRKAIELDPKYQWPRLGLGTALMAQGNRDEAIACYRTVIELDPKNVWAYRQLGVALQKLGNWDEAIDCYRTAIELDPKYAPTHNNLGTALYRAGRWQDAIETLERADRLSGGKHFSSNAFVIGMAHWQLGDKQAARKWYDQAVQWMETNGKGNEELQRFRIEAAELLELEKKTN